MRLFKCSLLLLLQFPTLLFADAWNVQVGAFGSQGEAQALRQRLETSEIPHLSVQHEEPWFRVYVGPFERFVDAQLTKDALRTKFQVDSFIKKGTGEAALSAVDPSDIGGAFFKKVDLQSAAPISDNEEYVRLETLDTAENKEQYLAELVRVKSSIPAQSARRGYVDVNLGIGKIIEKKYDEALALLKPVADGEVIASKAHRVMAMRRVGWLTHRAGNRLEAYRAYRDLEKYSESVKVKALCKVECAGLIMELAESGKGTHEEVRAEIAKALAQIPESEIQHRATLELMNAETFSRQPATDWNRAAELNEQLYQRLKSLGAAAPQREMVTALRQAGYDRIKNRDKDIALKHYEELSNNFPDDVDHFEGYNPHVLALYDLSYLDATLGNMEQLYQIKKEILKNFPEEEIAKRIAKAHPELVQEIASEDAAEVKK